MKSSLNCNGCTDYGAILMIDPNGNLDADHCVDPMLDLNKWSLMIMLINTLCSVTM